MILICGIPSETPLQRVRDELIAMGVPVVVFNQRYFDQIEIAWSLKGVQLRGSLKFNGAGYRLEDFEGIYARFMDDSLLPEVQGPDHIEKVKKCRKVHYALMQWMELTPAKVVNRMQAMLSNGSKPYQMQLIRQFGFNIPETLITNNPGEVRKFLKKHKRIIYKSTSGVRSVVKEFDDKDEKKLEKIRWCPVQFQKWIPGDDVRIHVIGEKIIATRIISEAIDYRYASSENKKVSLVPFEPEPKIRKSCIELTKFLGLAFSGIDLRYTPDGEVFCFEVNPSPGYSYYESHTGQPIARAVAEYLVS